jgi:hypothetical protein
MRMPCWYHDTDGVYYLPALRYKEALNGSWTSRRRKGLALSRPEGAGSWKAVPLCPLSSTKPVRLGLIIPKHGMQLYHHLDWDDLFLVEQVSSSS